MLDEAAGRSSAWILDKLTRVNDQEICNACSKGMVHSSTREIDIIGCNVAGTIPGLMLHRTKRLPNAVAYSEFCKGAWRDVTWQEMARTVARYRMALDLAGMVRGDRVAVLLANCLDWIAFDIAAMANGLITVPLYLHDSVANIHFILTNSGVRLCLIDSAERWNKLGSVIARGGCLTEVWVRSGDQTPQSVEGTGVRRLADVLRVAEEGDPGPLRCVAQDIATLIHTSGTTGRPKGAMLSHHALLWNAEAVTEFIRPLTSDVFLSLLPLAHAFERTMSYHMAMMGGSRVFFARSTETLRQDLLDVRPTILIAVPQLYERIHDAIQSKVAQSPIRRWLTKRAAEIGWQRFEARHGKADPPSVVTRFLVWPLLERLAARPVLRAFGGRLRVAVSGGAPLSTNVSHFLIGLGLPLVEGYGLTEAAPVVTATTLEDNAPGSVGRSLRGVELRLGREGELLVKSPSLMRGYWQDPAGSLAAIDGDGWLHTGDIAEFRGDRVFITGRLKELIVLSTGKKVASTSIEAAIKADPLFGQCCVFGNNRAAIIAIVVLCRSRWETFAKLHNLDPNAPNTPTATTAILTRITEATRDQPSFAKVRAVHALLQPWTVEDGSLTPTLKIKRQVVADRYQNEIEALYSRQASCHYSER